MSDSSLRGPTRDPAADRAVAILRQLRGMETDEPMLATPMERVTARIIDLGLLVATSLLVGFAASVVVLAIHADSADREPPWVIQRDVAAASNLVALAALAVFVGIEAFGRGQSIGKRIVGLRVVTFAERSAVGPGLLLLRLCVWFVPFIACFAGQSAAFAAGRYGLSLALMAAGAACTTPALVMFFTDDGRGLHDRLTGTVVTRPR